MQGGGKWEVGGREVGTVYPPVHPLIYSIVKTKTMVKNEKEVKIIACVCFYKA